MSPDKKLLKIYQEAFARELWGKPELEYGNTLNKRASMLGKNHAILGDDNRNFDYLSEEEILILIRGNDLDRT